MAERPGLLVRLRAPPAQLQAIVSAVPVPGRRPTRAAAARDNADDGEPEDAGDGTHTPTVSGAVKRKGGARRGPATGRGPAKKRRKVPGNTETTQAASIRATIPVELDEINIACSSQTPLLQKWLAATKDGKMQLTGPTPAFTVESLLSPQVTQAREEEAQKRLRRRKELAASSMPVTAMQDAAVYDNRAFEVVEVLLHSVTRKLPPQPAVEIKIWSIFVQDSNRPDSPRLTVYGETRAPLGGALEAHICVTEQNARDLGAAVCTLMDRFPAPLQEERWHQVGTNISHPRRIIQILALDLWQPGFDYKMLHEEYWTRYPMGGTMLATVVVRLAAERLRVNPKKPLTIKRVLPLFCEGFLDLSENDTQLEVSLDATKLDYEAIEQITPAMILRLLDYIDYNILGKVGGLAQLQEYAASLWQPYTTQKKQSTGRTAGWQNKVRVLTSSGPFGGQPFWVCWVADSIILMPSALAKASVTVGLTTITALATMSKLNVAYVMNQMLIALSAGRDAANSWQAGIVAVETMRLRLVTTEDILAQQCLCVNDLDRDCNCHVCALCWAVRLCRDMAFSAEDGRLLCSTHTDTTLEEPLTAWVHRKASNAVRRVGRGIEPNHTQETRREYKTKVESFMDHSSDNVWHDAYDGARSFNWRTFKQAAEGATSGRGSNTHHPLRLTVDAVLPLVVIGGQSFIHHADNIVATADCLNAVKHVWAPCVLPVFRKAALQTQRERATGEPRDHGVWNQVNIALDHVHQLATLLSTRQKSRTSGHLIDPDSPGKVAAAWKSGVWSVNLPRPQSRSQFRPISSGGEQISDKGLADFISGKSELITQNRRDDSSLEPEVHARKAAIKAEARTRCHPWDEIQQKKLADLVEQIESDSTTNPTKLVIPRGPGGAPWPFRPDHMFSGDSNLWVWWHREMVHRYSTMLEWCNYAHETDESPATLFGVIIVQWFERGGGPDAYIYCEMTIWMLHPARFSLGRADFVKPGSPMCTGFTVPFPTNFRMHYDKKRCTVVVQPYFVNLLWHNYTADCVPLLLPALAEISPETVHYDHARQDLPRVSYPKESMVSRRERRKAAKQGKHASEGLDDVVEDELAANEGDELDEDQAFWSDEEPTAFMEGDTIEADSAGPSAADDQGVGPSDGEAMTKPTSDPHDPPPEERFNCKFCNQHDVDGSMIFCAGLHGALMHFWCAGLDAVPQTYLPVYCPECKTLSTLSQHGVSDLPKNLPNIGSTCYVSSSVQILRSLKEVRDIVADRDNIVCKPLQQSGRLAQEWLTSVYDVVASTPAMQKEEMSAQHMANAKGLADGMRTIFRRIEGQGGDVSWAEMQQFFDTVKAYDPKEWQEGTMNDAASLFVDLLNCLTLVTDESTPSGRGRLLAINAKNQHNNENDEPQEPLSTDCPQRYYAYCNEGRVSAITGLFTMQVVSEWQCADPTCNRVGRGNGHEMVLQLGFPEGTKNDQSFTLHELLQQWAVESVPEGINCVFVGDIHRPLSTTRIKRITYAPPILMISFSRHDRLRLNHVDIPEFLDITPYADGVTLPSERLAMEVDPETKHALFGNDWVYRLFAVNVFVPPDHFIAYVAHGQQWIVLDDKQGRAGVKPSHPQAAINDGYVPYYVVYVREKGRRSLPVDEVGIATEGFVLTRHGHVPGPGIRTYGVAEPEKFTCPAAESAGCTETFSTQQEAELHANVHNAGDDTTMVDDSEIVCATCGLQCSSEANLRDHEHTHQQQFICDACSQAFDSRADLESHQQTVHPEIRCTSCSACFASQQELADHQRTQHGQTGGSLEEQYEALRQAIAAANRATDTANQAAATADQATATANKTTAEARLAAASAEQAATTANEAAAAAAQATSDANERMKDNREVIEQILVAERNALRERIEAIDSMLARLR